MKSSGRFTPSLRRLVYHSYDTCGNCGGKITAPDPALAGYDIRGSPTYVGDCCKNLLKELASHIYWSWHVDRRCAPDQKLWRYMDFAKFISLIEDCTLYFSRTDRLGDPFEGAAGIAERQSVWDEHYKAWFRQAMLTIPGRKEMPSEEQLAEDAFRLLGELKAGLEHERRHNFVNCWHANSVESEALWRLYCPPPHPGIVIQTTAAALETSLGEDADVEIARVRYIDFKSAFSGPYERIFTKRKSLSHEAEVRAVIRRTSMKNPPVGLAMPVDLKQLVSAVVPSPFSAPWFRHLLERTLKRYGVDVPICDSELLSEPFF